MQAALQVDNELQESAGIGPRDHAGPGHPEPLKTAWGWIDARLASWSDVLA